MPRRTLWNAPRLLSLGDHRAEGNSGGELAWSSDGRYIALATMGMPPDGGVFVYERFGDTWKLVPASIGTPLAEDPQTWRHVRVMGDDNSMDTFGNFSLPTKGVDYLSSLHQCEATPWEAAWISEQVERLKDVLPAAESKPRTAKDGAKWFTGWLKQHASSEPLATAAAVKVWQKQHDIRLPKDYVKFVTTAGAIPFADMFGLEGYDVNIVGPDGLDAEGYRHDLDDEAEEQSPDRLMFATAINGDCLCFDLRGEAGILPVYHYDHETEVFQPFADDFVAAVRRLAERK